MAGGAAGRGVVPAATEGNAGSGAAVATKPATAPSSVGFGSGWHATPHGLGVGRTPCSETITAPPASRGGGEEVTGWQATRSAVSTKSRFKVPAEATPGNPVRT